VQVLEELGPKLAGTQASADGVTGAPTPVTTPPVGRTTMPLPPGEDPTALLTPMEVADTPEAIVRSTYAIAPFEIIPAFIPDARHV
jgi:hypothetical protein